MDTLICRTLRREYRLHVPNDEARWLFSFLVADPQMDGWPLEPVEVSIGRTHGFWRLEIKDELLLEGTSRHIVWEFYKHAFRDIHLNHPHSPVLHGASILLNGRRFAIAGRKGAGKTTLTLNLLAAGYQVEGDEHIVLEPGRVIARPRTLRVRQRSLELVGNLPFSIESQPRIGLWDGGQTYAISPRAFGRPWVLQQGNLDGVILVDANHGGRSAIKPIPKSLVFEEVMKHVYLQKSGIPLQVAKIRAIATQAPAFWLRLGDLAGAKSLLDRVAAS